MTDKIKSALDSALESLSGIDWINDALTADPTAAPAAQDASRPATVRQEASPAYVEALTIALASARRRTAVVKPLAIPCDAAWPNPCTVHAHVQHFPTCATCGDSYLSGNPCH